MQEYELNWKESSPGVWTRDFDGLERFFHFMSTIRPDSPFIPWVLTLGATLPQNVPIEDLKEAWKALRYHHPMIACKIGGRSYEYRTLTDADEWAQNTLIVDNTRESGIQVLTATPIHPDHPALLYFFPERNEIALQLRHEITDGVGTIMLLNNLIRLIKHKTSVEFGDEAKNLAPAVSKVLSLGEPSDDITKWANRMVDQWKSTPSIGLTAKALTGQPMEAQQFLCQFPANETTAIVKACKRLGLTPTHAVTAAVAKAILEHGGTESGAYSSWFNVNIRDQLPAPYDKPDWAAAVFFTSFLCTLPLNRSTPFLELAEKVKQEYNTWRYHDEKVGTQGVMADSLIEAVITGAKMGVVLPANVPVSSLGLVEQYITEPVDDFWFNAMTATPQSVLFLYTIHGSLRLSFSYNAAYHERKSIEDFFELVKEYLYKGLDLEF